MERELETKKKRKAIGLLKQRYSINFGDGTHDLPKHCKSSNIGGNQKEEVEKTTFLTEERGKTAIHLGGGT